MGRTAPPRGLWAYKLGAEGALALHSCEMSEPGVFDAIFAECDAVIHTADGGYPSVTSGEEYAATNRHILASIQAAPHLARLVYTSSDEAMLDSDLSLLEANPIVDHRRYTHPDDPNSYGSPPPHPTPPPPGLLLRAH